MNRRADFSGYIAQESMKSLPLHFLLICCGVLITVASPAQERKAAALSAPLQKTLRTHSGVDTITVLAAVKNISTVKQSGAVVLRNYKSTSTVLMKVSADTFLSLLKRNEIIFADLSRKPKEEVTTGSLDIALNKVSLAHEQYPNVNGQTINVSLQEQRFDTSDIDIKGRFFESGVASGLSSSHAAIMATILAGGGNSSPFARGAAWGANITSSDYTSLLPDADSVYRHYDISVQNHSYGTGIENYYGADAASFDMSVWNNPLLVHVFSSGNSGASTSTSGLYAGVEGFANLTGSFKMAKNIITVGATDSFNTVAPLSSRGPAFDGRVKPELVAFGEDGSSGAAALVSGTAALVQQFYRMETDTLPSAAMVKAILLNSADDVGEEHVDFASGYGSLNASAALSTVTKHRFAEGQVSQDEVKSFTISVPEGIAQLKVTVAWSDTAATPNASKALVNDLDALLENSVTGESWQPWVLHSFANKDSLALPAVRARDSLNNVEQITIDHPQQGHYVLQVFGGVIQTKGPQIFALAWQMDTVNTFRWTWPGGQDVLAAGIENVVYWQTNVRGTGSLEYSTNGVQWKTIASSVDLGRHYFKWQTPDTNAKAYLRMQMPTAAPVTSDAFVMAKPVHINVGFDCVDSFLMYWNSYPSSRYQVYRLGTKYLEPLQEVGDSFIVLQKQSHPDVFYSVAPLIDGKPGLRSYTIDYTMQGVGCYTRSFYATMQNGAALLRAELGTLYQVSEIAFQKITASGIQTLQTLAHPQSTDLNFLAEGLRPGANMYRLQIKLNDGRIIYSDPDVVYYFPHHPVIVYPNPARQGEGIRIIARDPGVYTIVIYDANGRELRTQYLDDISQSVAPVYLSKGVYFIRVVPENGETFVEKLVVF